MNSACWYENRNNIFETLPFWPKPIIRGGLSHITTIQTWIRVPVHVQLRSTGFLVGFQVPALYPRLAD